MIRVNITNRMREVAKIESNRRDAYINHHFEVPHFTSLQRDIVGFLGEFSACNLFNINWQENIRSNYLVADHGDISKNSLIFDVKTETLPYKYLNKLLNNSIDDDELYGRRLINSNQVQLLNNYDIVIFGAMDRNNLNSWYPIGYLSTSYILNNYNITYTRPDGGQYPFAALAIRTSDLLPIENLLNYSTSLI